MASLHSSIVGGSTAKRVINCPGSVALCAKMPPKPSSEHADRGTLLHDAIADILGKDLEPRSVIGRKHEGIELTEELFEEKLVPALKALDEIDPDCQMDLVVENYVNFGDFIPGAFGSADVIGKLGRKAVILDWKFGDGVVVEAEENDQGLFYAGAAMRTPAVQWAFEDIDEVEIIIVQPPEVKRWTTSVERIKQFEIELARAVKLAQTSDAPIKDGSHCRWCAAKPTCPLKTGEVERVQKIAIQAIDKTKLSEYLVVADALEDWIKDVRALAHQILDSGAPVPGFKLVSKRATRQWKLNKDETMQALFKMELNFDDIFSKPELLSPAQVEKVLKKRKLELPDDLVMAISSGTTMASESDPRPAVLKIGQQMTAALSKLN